MNVHEYGLGAPVYLESGSQSPVLEAAVSAGFCDFLSISNQFRPWKPGVQTVANQ